MKYTKNILLSSIAVMALGNMANAGGDFSPVIVYETQDEVQSMQVPLEVVQETIQPSEIVETIIQPIETVAETIPAIVKPVAIEEDSPLYAGIGLAAGQAKASDCEDKTYGVMAKVGYDFSEYIGVEARGLRTNWDYEGGKLKHIGAFLKPQYPVSEDLKLYGLVGYAKTSMGSKRNFSDTGLAYGAGLDYALNEDFGVFVDYERLLHDAGIYDLDALALGLSYGF